LLLMPGMTAVLRVIVSDTGETLKVPNQALRFRPGGNGAEQQNKNAGSAAGARVGTVWVTGSDGVPSAVPITLGASDGDSTQVTSGKLQEGDQLIVGTAAPRGRDGLLGLRLGF
jgi:HlyD family secretion protein